MQANHSIHPQPSSSKKAGWFIFLFLLITVIGLTYVKWWPYYHKAIGAMNTHSIGDSILGDMSGSSFSWENAWQYAVTYFQSVWKAALLGIILGSLVQVLLPARWLLKVLGKTSFGSTAAGGLASIPGMMCTCCAAPIAVGLRKSRASVGAALAFWLGNPLLNPATLIFMAFVLSWEFTVLRLAAGLILVFGVSYLANRFSKNSETVEMDDILAEDAQTQNESVSFFSKWMKSLGIMLLYVVPAYFLSVLFLGAAKVWLFPDLSGFEAAGLIAIILFAITGMLFVIPTAAEIPIIQTMMSLGIGGGPAAALLITLPAISLPSILIVGKSFPKKALGFVILSVVLVGILSGLAGMWIF